MARIAHLRAIQVFETVARTGNISSAAEALALTQSAVSYHINVLEQDLGVKLFDRGSRGVCLTEHGETFIPFVRDGLDSFERGLQALKKSEGSTVVRVAVLPMFASRWLAPRLSSFWDQYPKTELLFSHDNNTYSNKKDPSEIADIAIQWGYGDWPNVESRLLLNAPLVPACSPDLLKRAPIRSVADLANHSLLHVDNHAMWRQWLGAAGADPAIADKGLLMSDRHFQLSATLSGVGVSLFIKSFIKEELESEKLVIPLDQEYRTQFAYYLVRPKHAKNAAIIRQFHDWVLSYADRS
jgi:LysR family transcriptional regulator, glycine cleavage system transcriptional activator